MKCNNCTAAEIARSEGISRRTLFNCVAFADAVDSIGVNVGEHVKCQILSGTSGLTTKAVIAIGKMPAREQSAGVEFHRANPRLRKPKQSIADFVQSIRGQIERFCGDDDAILRRVRCEVIR